MRVVARSATFTLSLATPPANILDRVLFKRANNNREAGNPQRSNTQSLLNTVRGCFESKHRGVRAAALAVGLFNQPATSKCACLKCLPSSEGKLDKPGGERDRWRQDAEGGVGTQREDEGEQE